MFSGFRSLWIICFLWIWSRASQISQIIFLASGLVILPSLIDRQGIFPAYHMNKQHWISVVLDKNTDKAMLFDLIEMSYDLINKKR